MTAHADLRAAFAGSTVLITGGLGFIGSHLAEGLVELGASVTIADSLVPEYGGQLFNVEAIRGKVEVNISDVRDRHSIAYLIRDKDYLFNLAGQTSHLDSMTDPFTDLDINCTSQLAILEACRLHNLGIRIVFASTRQIYGRPRYLPVDESHPVRPVDVNGINKLAGEAYHLLYSEVYGIPTCVLRLTNTYGPRMRIKDARQTFLGIWLRSVLEDRSFEVWEGGQLRDFTYVDDAVAAILMCAANQRATGNVYNLGGPDPPITLSDLAALLVEVAGHGNFGVRPYPHDRKKIDIGDYFADFSRLTRDVGWLPLVGLREGLRATVDFYRKNLGRYLG